MRLRLRSLESKETLKLDLPDSSTLQQLQQALSQSLPSSPPPPPSLRFSLNRKHCLHLSSPQDSLLAAGVASGDLIYFSRNPNDFLPDQDQAQAQAQEGNFQEPVFVESDENLVPGMSSGQEVNVVESVNFEESTLKKSKTVEESEDVDVDVAKEEENHVKHESEKFHESEMPGRELSLRGQSDVSNRVESDTQMTETSEFQDLGSLECMDVNNSSGVSKSCSVPCFLRRVLSEELGGDVSSYHLFVVAIHAVLLESGFVGFHPVSRMQAHPFCSHGEAPSSLSYTVPELLGNQNVCHSVVLKFQRVARFVNVYGFLAEGGSRVYRLHMDGHVFGPMLDLVQANEDNNDGPLRSNLENEVFEFWKKVKDGLALPLLIDLCEKTGLALPACLMLLPAELKLKILESLPGVDVARMGCVCSEMRYLSSNSDLWKQKFTEEFGSRSLAKRTISWKEKFALCWEIKKMHKREANARQPFRPNFYRHYHPLIWRDPQPFGAPWIIGGEHDLIPEFGFRSLLRPRGPPLHGFRRNFSPNCDLGGFGS